MKTPSQAETKRITWAISGVVAIWGAAVVAGAETGFFAALYMPLIAAIVAATIILPTLIYFAWPRLQAYADSIGHSHILLFHTWRVPAEVPIAH